MYIHACVRRSKRAARDAASIQVVHGLRQSLVFEEALEEDRVLDCPGLLPGLTFCRVCHSCHFKLASHRSVACDAAYIQ